MKSTSDNHQAKKAIRKTRMSLNPLARKRWNRFRRHKRGFWSLIIIIALYGMSLASELICNDKPAYVQFEGDSYFPIFKFYPDDVFTGSGLRTRPDYKTLNQSWFFGEIENNYMTFTPFRYGPYEIINPDSLREHERVYMTIKAKTRVASINVNVDLDITRAQSAEYFLGENSTENLNASWILSSEVIDGLALRFSNERAPEVVSVITNRLDDEVTAEVKIRAYKPRRTAPRDVRLTFREVDEDAATRSEIVFNRELKPIKTTGSLWRSLNQDQQQQLVQQASNCFARVGAEPGRLEIDGRTFTSSVRLDEVVWPFRPVPGHWFGIDNAGRDVLARILYGLRTSMNFGLLLVVVSMGLGIMMGALQGFYGGKMDLLGQRFIEIWSTIPFLYVMILLGSMYGRSFSLLLFCYGLFNWIGISYYVRAEFLKLRHTPFVDAARCLGITPGRIMFRHILPNALTPIITFLPFSLVGAIGSLAILDFLGFGLPPPIPSWGELLQQAQAFRWAWWLILYPSSALFLVILLVVFIGEGVRDAYDPKPVMRME